MTGRAVAVLLACASGAMAQAPSTTPQLHATVGLAAGTHTVRSRTADGRELLTGFTLAGEGVVERGALRLRIRYGQGHLTPDTARATILERRFTEGEALLGYRARPWLTVWVGPHARTYATHLGKQRWLFWEVRGQAHVTVLADRMTSFLEIWAAPAGDVDVRESFGSGRGAEGGIQVLVAGPDVWARLAYRIEQARMGGGTRRETVDAVLLGVAVPVRE
ncbi:MAG: hypothetical protein ACREL9_13665 [Gemmatimonadales bacterium]